MGLDELFCKTSMRFRLASAVKARSRPVELIKLGLLLGLEELPSASISAQRAIPESCCRPEPLMHWEMVILLASPLVAVE